jgi:hypothetical protein
MGSKQKGASAMLQAKHSDSNEEHEDGAKTSDLDEGQWQGNAGRQA